MRHSRLVFGILLAIFAASMVSAQTLRIDMDDPRRAVGREDDIRIDAELNQDAVASGAPVMFTCEVQNLSKSAIALSDNVTASYDADSRTVTVAVGSEVPSGGIMPRMTIIPSGGKKIFAAGPTLHVSVPTGSRYAAVPRYVQFVVHVLRDLAPFREALEARARTAKVSLNDELFSKWLESNDTIVLNALPVRYDEGRRSAMAGTDAENRTSGSLTLTDRSSGHP